MLRLCFLALLVSCSFGTLVTVTTNANQTRHYHPLRRVITAISIDYEFYCLNNGYGNYVALKGGDSSTISFTGDLIMDLTVTAHPTNGKNDNKFTSISDDTQTVTISGSYAFDGTFALFNKGGGAPIQWAASTGNPYIYFEPQNGWTCSFDVTPPDSCENLYCSKGNLDVPCAWGKEISISGAGGQAPPRTRTIGSLYVGRCSQWHDTVTSPDFVVTCSIADASTSLTVFPDCKSAGHNIVIGAGIDIQDHHKIVGSQISPKKFATHDDACYLSVQGAGPHEDVDDDTCLRSPPMGAFLDKSAGNPQQQQCTSTLDGAFTSCAFGGNPCLETYTCKQGDGSACFDGFGTDIIGSISSEYCTVNGRCDPGCRCSEIRTAVRDMEISCDESYSTSSAPPASATSGASAGEQATGQFGLFNGF